MEHTKKQSISLEGKSFEETMKVLLSYAILAPNSHNTQPWKFKIIENGIEVYFDYSRCLFFSDRSYREAYISIGCAIENFTTAAGYFDWIFDKQYLPEDSMDDALIRVTVKKHILQEPIDKPIFEAMKKRVTTRSKHTSQQIQSSDIEHIKSFATKNISVDIFTDVSDKEKIGHIVYRATKEAFEDRVFKRELSSWVRPNITKKSDGMPMYGWDIILPMSLFAPFLVRFIPAEYRGRRDQWLSKNSGGILILSTPEDRRKYWLEAGEVFEKIALYCTTQNLVISPLGGPIEHEKSKEKLRDMLPEKKIPVLFSRFGYPTSLVPHSPRRLLEEVLIKS